MPTPESQKKASAKWNRSRDNIMLRATKEDGETIRAAAEKAGKKVSPFILEIVLNHIQEE